MYADRSFRVLVSIIDFESVSRLTDVGIDFISKFELTSHVSHFYYCLVYSE